MELGRSGLIKSKGACETCRIRHVKCDECKPTCLRCQKDRQKCDGYRTFQNSRRGNMLPRKSHSLAAPLPALPAFDDPLQRDLFSSFVACAANASSLYFGANFWARRVLQLSLSEASIRYALCSLSALHRISTISPAHPYSIPINLRNYALQQYNHAVRCTQALLAQSSDGSKENLIKGLVACVLFVCYENFIGNYETSHMHLQNGLRIITIECRKQRNSHSTIPKDIVQVFKRLDVQAISITNSKAPYSKHAYKEPIEILSVPPTGYDSIEDSIDVILHLCRWLFRRAAASESCPVAQEDLNDTQKAVEQYWDATN